MSTHPNPETEELADNPLAQITGFQRDLVVVLSKVGPCIGESVRERLIEDGYSHVNHGRLYPNLDALAVEGFVDIDRDGIDGRSNSYQLTNDGVSALAQYRAWISGGTSDD